MRNQHFVETLEAPKSSVWFEKPKGKKFTETVRIRHIFQKLETEERVPILLETSSRTEKLTFFDAVELSSLLQLLLAYVESAEEVWMN